MKRIIYVIIALLCLFSCKSRDPRLERVSQIVSDTPKDALASLDSIDRNSLNQSDRNFYDLMRIKANDKLDIPHTTDSLILKITDYYSKERNSPEYLEAIYYCGRVYSDLGDYPSAMKYYQEVINSTEYKDSDKALEIRGNALSQLTSILGYLRLDDEFIKYSEKLIRQDFIMKDTVNAVIDQIYLASQYLKMKKLKKAEEIFNKADSLCPKNMTQSRALINVYLASIKYRKGESQRAWDMLSPYIFEVDTNVQGIPLTYAAYITFNLGKYDSTYFFCKKILSLKDISNHKNAYEVLLRREMEKNVPLDSSKTYIYLYRKLLSDELEHNEDHAALLQNGQYNYSVHERERDKAEKEKSKLFIWLLCSLVIILILSFLYLFQILRRKMQTIMLYKAYTLMSVLGRKIRRERNGEHLLIGYAPMEEFDEEAKDIIYINDRASLREILLNNVYTLVESGKDSYSVSPIIYESSAYKRLMEAVSNNEILNNNEKFWDELEDAVIKESKNFMKNLSILLGGRIKESERRVALLVKCGVKPTEMKKLLSLEKGTISYRRSALGEKAFGKKLDTKTVDKLIRLL